MGDIANLGMGLGSLANAYNQTEAMALQSEFQAKMFERNQKLAEVQADDALKRGDLAASKYKTNVNQTIGAQRASFAAQGLDINSGSAADIQTETSKFGALDQITIKTNAWREAYGYKTNANLLGMQGGMAQVGAKNQMFNTALTGGLQFLNYATKASYGGGGVNWGSSNNWGGGIS